jgi:deazaflavin-dependent oxidoreductase (nitroreductase family)
VTRTRELLARKGLKGMGAVHTLLYRATRGRVGAEIWGLPILFLTTTGRKTGKPRTNPLCFLPDGEDVVVVASNAGLAWEPAWLLNLRADPHATVRIASERRAVRAREATPGEREALWRRLVAIAPGYLRYERRTSRVIPLVILAHDSQPARGSL